MASKTFTLGDEKQDLCVRILLVIITIGVVLTVGIVGYYVFKSASGSEFDGGCKSPILDPYSMSNWTAGAQVIAFACLQHHAIQESDIVISQCSDAEWVPEPPICVALPIHLACAVDKNGLQGTIHMWQESKKEPLNMKGTLSTQLIDKSQGLFREALELSRSTCVSHPFDELNTTLLDEHVHIDNETYTTTPKPNAHDFIRITIKTNSLVAFKKVELKITMVFVDLNTTATLVSATQGDVTVVMAKPITDASTAWTWDGLNSSLTGKNGDVAPSSNPQN